MSTRIEASWESLEADAAATVARSLARAVQAIDREFGDGYAAQHPELVAAFIRAAAENFKAASVAVGAQWMADAIREVAPDANVDGSMSGEWLPRGHDELAHEPQRTDADAHAKARKEADAQAKAGMLASMSRRGRGQP